MTRTATGTFQIKMQPHAPTAATGPPIGRMFFGKTWEGELQGTSQGEMLSVGDPASGTAAYTVMEVFTGTLAGRQGGFAFHQFGTMHGGSISLLYEIVPHSGSGELAGIKGALTLTVVEKVHGYSLKYALPDKEGG